MFYLIGHQPHCHIEECQDGLTTTHSLVDKMLVCSDHHTTQPSFPPNKACSSSNIAVSGDLKAVQSTEQTFQLPQVEEKDMGKFFLDRIMLAENLGLLAIIVFQLA